MYFLTVAGGSVVLGAEVEAVTSEPKVYPSPGQLFARSRKKNVVSVKDRAAAASEERDRARTSTPNTANPTTGLQSGHPQERTWQRRAASWWQLVVACKFRVGRGSV